MWKCDANGMRERRACVTRVMCPSSPTPSPMPCELRRRSRVSVRRRDETLESTSTGLGACATRARRRHGAAWSRSDVPTAAHLARTVNGTPLDRTAGCGCPVPTRRVSCPVVRPRPAGPPVPVASRDERKSRNGYAINLKSNPRVICKTHRETDIITHETGAVELSLWPCAVSHARDRLLPVRFCLEIAKRG